MIRRNFFSILMSVLILYLSLSEADNFDRVSFFNIPGLDKIVHFVMYFILMCLIIIENRLKNEKILRILLYALIPFLYGVTMELLQLTLTETRTGSIADVLFNGGGILSSVILFSFLLRLSKKDA